MAKPRAGDFHHGDPGIADSEIRKLEYKIADLKSVLHHPNLSQSLRVNYKAELFDLEFKLAYWKSIRASQRARDMGSK